MSDTSHPTSDTATAAASIGGHRKTLIAAIFGVFIVAAIAWGAYWARVARFAASTDDAYVAGNVVQITPQIAGTVVAIRAQDTDLVAVGTPLVELDPADAELNLRHSEAQLAQTVRDVRKLFSNTRQLEAAASEREVALLKARADLQRRERLAASGAVAAEEVQHARDAVRGAEAALTAAREQLAGNRALIDGTRVSTNPRVEQAAARVRTALLDARRTTLPAPVSGVVAQRSVQVGQRVAPGNPLMAIVPLDQMWVQANFKEGQLADIRVGQAARVVADANGFAYHGKVAGFGAGTGAAFALLPAQNATGNWIKVVQRLPVRIALDATEIQKHPLAIGLSMDVTVDTHDRQGAQLKQAASPDPDERTTAFTQPEGAADELIAGIIARNTHVAGAQPMSAQLAIASRAAGSHAGLNH